MSSEDAALLFMSFLGIGFIGFRVIQLAKEKYLNCREKSDAAILAEVWVQVTSVLNTPNDAILAEIWDEVVSNLNTSKEDRDAD